MHTWSLLWIPFFGKRRTCCPRSHGLRPKKLSVCVVVPPAPVRVPSQRPLAPSVASLTLVANDKGDNEMILGAVHRFPGTCLTAEENPRKPQLGDRLMKGLCDQSSPQMGSLSSNLGLYDRPARQEKEGIKERTRVYE